MLLAHERSGRHECGDYRRELHGDYECNLQRLKVPSVTVDSYTQITTTVPTGAKTRKIGVTTSGDTATSSGTFMVMALNDIGADR
jgi:hypothetical protein